MSTARHRPEVVLISTMSLDGRITLGPHQRLLQPEVSSRWKSIEVAGAFPHRGAELDERVVLQGSGSFVDADATAPAWQAPSRATAELWEDYLPRKSTNWFVVADSRGRVDWAYTGDADTALHILVCRATPPGYLHHLRELGVGYFIVGDRQVDLAAALIRLGMAFETSRIVVDSGGTLNAALLRANLVDYLDVVILPGIVGGLATPSIVDGWGLAAGELPIRLTLLELTTDRDSVRLRYRVCPSQSSM